MEFVVFGWCRARLDFTHIAVMVAPRQTSRQDLTFRKLAKRVQAVPNGGHLPSCKHYMR